MAYAARVLRSAVPALAALALAVGCGGGDDEGSAAPPTQTEAETTSEAALELRPVLDRLSATLDEIELVAAAEDCGQAGKLRRLRARMVRQTRALARFEDEPEFAADVRDLLEFSHDAEVSIVETLAACRAQRELERAADEIDKLADEADQLGEP